MDTKLLVNVEELSNIISIPTYTIRRMAKEGTIPGYKPNRKWLFDPAEVVKTIKEGVDDCKVH